MSGHRFVYHDIFQLKPSNHNRTSQRLREEKPEHSLILQTSTFQKNTLEGKMGVQKSIVLWNALEDDIIKLYRIQFQSKIKSDSLFVSLCDVGVIDCVSDV
jgi:hypothetical protein